MFRMVAPPAFVSAEELPINPHALDVAAERLEDDRPRLRGTLKSRCVSPSTVPGIGGRAVEDRFDRRVGSRDGLSLNASDALECRGRVALNVVPRQGIAGAPYSMARRVACSGGTRPEANSITSKARAASAGMVVR